MPWPGRKTSYNISINVPICCGLWWRLFTDYYNVLCCNTYTVMDKL